MTMMNKRRHFLLSKITQISTLALNLTFNDQKLQVAPNNHSRETRIKVEQLIEIYCNSNNSNVVCTVSAR